MKPKFARLIRLGLFLPLWLSVFAASDAANASQFSVLYTFKGGSDGEAPWGRLLVDKGNLFGVTLNGGREKPSCISTEGCGTVYEVTPTGAETVLYRFAVKSSGLSPSGLARDKRGNLYGTTFLGGPADGSRCGTDHWRCGVVFKLAPDGTETVLHGFIGPDGARPIGLAKDTSGNLFGTSSYGCCGQVFKVAPNGSESTFYAFTGGSDGAYPEARVIADTAGNLYGTTFGGGMGCNGYGCGTVYRIAPDGTETILYAFSGGTDGWGPQAPLKMDNAGNLYGTAYGGGANGLGVVFKLAPNGVETVLHSFAGGSDGEGIYTNGLSLDSSGNVYGATVYGGGTRCTGYGCGTVYRIAPDGTEKILHSFAGKADGAFPESDLVLDDAGNVYGTALSGGSTICSGGCGTLFKIAP